MSWSGALPSCGRTASRPRRLAWSSNKSPPARCRTKRPCPCCTNGRSLISPPPPAGWNNSPKIPFASAPSMNWPESPATNLNSEQSNRKTFRHAARKQNAEAARAAGWATIQLRIIFNAQALIADAPLSARPRLGRFDRRTAGDPALHPHRPGPPGSVVRAQKPRRSVLVRRGRPGAGVRLSTKYWIPSFAQYSRLPPLSPSSLTA